MISRLRTAFYWTKGKFFFEEDSVVEALDYFWALSTIQQRKAYSFCWRLADIC